MSEAGCGLRLGNRKFKANLYVARKTNEVCPFKWREEGDKTLINPGAKMVGKVHEALRG